MSTTPTIRDLVIPKTFSNVNDASSSGALTGTPSLESSKYGTCNCVAEAIRRMITLRKNGTDEENGFMLVNNNEVNWAKLFMEFILGSAYCQSSKCQAHSDDMIWYVHQTKLSASFYLQGQNSLIQVFRRHSKNQPAPCDESYNWEETFCLNFIMQQLDFFVTCAVCTKTGPQNLQIIRKNRQRVFPSPSRRRMDSKGESEEITYPKLYFAIDGFDEVFQDVVVRDGECVCVELIARDRQSTREAVIFLGSIRYEILKQVYDTKASSTWHWAQKLMKQGDRRQEFVRMRGPQGKGYAEMAVARVANCGYETPLSENAMDFSDLPGVEQNMGKRRMSETNLAGNKMFAPRPSVTTPSHSGRGRRWQSEADTVNQYPEVEGTNIDDELEEGAMNKLWSMRGFGQAWHWLREKKRAECTPLNALLTYVTLPWNNILNDLLSDHRKRPIFNLRV
ncbi:unnamed protein product [Caenorhabditis auriculariae]|uniref:Uncharacterized protein n=1 Tax=Caenorhabditis auriculariae TaxID=2777116 RepID=A0A8S1GXE3_9PELO|nr:unnamed protein product [Caenorhabditis auriculariae]